MTDEPAQSNGPEPRGTTPHGPATTTPPVAGGTPTPDEQVTAATDARPAPEATETGTETGQAHPASTKAEPTDADRTAPLPTGDDPTTPLSTGPNAGGAPVGDSGSGPPEGFGPPEPPAGPTAAPPTETPGGSNFGPPQPSVGGAGQAPPPPPPPPPPPGLGGSSGTDGGSWGGGWNGANWAANFNLGRHQLVRPTQGRHVAGVCAAMGRATNTDPVLWRVVLTVLSFFGGTGILLYLAGWLLIPSEGDTASPIESLLGRGRSSMSPLAIVLLGLAALTTFMIILHGGFRAAVLGAAVVAGGVLLLKRNGAAGPAPTGTPMTAPSGAAPGFAAPPPPAGGFAPPTAAYAPPTLPPAYGAPFAPHGPFAGPPPPPPPAPKPPRPPREKSKLGRLTFSMILIVLALMALIDMTASFSIPAAAYVAAALATVGAGLILGAWFGRARGLIALGILLSLALGATTAASSASGGLDDIQTWRPATTADLADRYSFDAGTGTLDLRSLNFAGTTKTVRMDMHAGRVNVLLPPTVDVTATVDLDVGEAHVFDQRWNGFDVAPRTVTDLGADGTGGGNLTLDLTMNAGAVEVSR